MKKFNITDPEIIYCITDPYIFICHFKLVKEFENEFKTNIDDYLEKNDTFDSDLNIYKHMIKYLDTEDICHFIIWDQYQGNYFLYQVHISIEGK